MDLSGYISLQPEFISMLHLGCSLERTQINYEVDVVVQCRPASVCCDHDSIFVKLPNPTPFNLLPVARRSSLFPCSGGMAYLLKTEIWSRELFLTVYEHALLIMSTGHHVLTVANKLSMSICSFKTAIKWWTSEKLQKGGSSF